MSIPIELFLEKKEAEKKAYDEKTDLDHYDDYLRAIQEMRRNEKAMAAMGKNFKKHMCELVAVICDSRDKGRPFNEFKYIINELLKYKEGEEPKIDYEQYMK